MKDVISKLPDEILIDILSRLTIKEAARTGILSSRWRFLWTFFTGSIDYNDLIDRGGLLKKFGLGDDYFDNLHMRKQKYVSWIEQIMGSLKGPTVEGLKICFDSNRNVHNWVQFAVEKRVQRLDLENSCLRLWECESYKFPSHFDIRSSFSSLTSLRLSRIDVGNEAVENLLSYCPLLEVLSLGYTKCLTSLRVSGASLKLKYLELIYLQQLKNLEVDAENLLSFVYSGAPSNVCFKHVPSLAEMSFEGDCCQYYMRKLYQLPRLLVHLRTLKLQVPSDELCCIPELPNLKHFELQGNIPPTYFLRVAAAFVKACPSLYKLTAKVEGVTYNYEQTMKNHPHLSLRVVELIGFTWVRGEVEFLSDLLECATRLEKVIIDPMETMLVGSTLELLYRESAEYKSYRKRAVELAAKFPRCEFVIL